MANTKANVTTGKPKIAGAIYRAPLGSTLPTTADATLDAAFVAMGYVSTDGVTNAISANPSNISAWGGDVVLIAEGEKSDTLQFTLIESLSKDVLSAVHGGDNVTGTLSAGISVAVNAGLQEEAVWVIDMLMRGNVAKRIVVPDGMVSALADVVYQDNAVVGYGLTVTCLPDASGNAHYEYIKQASGT